MNNQTDEQELDDLEAYLRNRQQLSAFVFYPASHAMEWQDLIAAAREGLKLREPCPLIHTHCAACGIAIGVNGLCGCPDNRVHPIAAIHKDAISTLTAELDSLRADRERLDLVMVEMRDAEACFEEDNIGCAPFKRALILLTNITARKDTK